MHAIEAISVILDIKWITGATLVGWLVAVACIIRKFDRSQDRLICLAGDLSTATFSALTLIVAFAIILQLNFLFHPIRKIQENVEYVVGWVNDDMSEKNNEIARLSKTLIEQLSELARNSNLSEESARELIIQKIGNSANFNITVNLTTTSTVMCSKDGINLTCSIRQ